MSLPASGKRFQAPQLFSRATVRSNNLSVPPSALPRPLRTSSQPLWGSWWGVRASPGSGRGAGKQASVHPGSPKGRRRWKQLSCPFGHNLFFPSLLPLPWRSGRGQERGKTPAGLGRQWKWPLPRKEVVSRRHRKRPGRASGQLKWEVAVAAVEPLGGLQRVARGGQEVALWHCCCGGSG